MFNAAEGINTDRYGRQLILPGWGVAAQRELASKKALLVGAGGLGSPILLYLSSAGIGTLGIIDGDTVDLSNLHRQVVHNEANCGQNKAFSARQKCLQLNSEACIEAYPYHLTAVNAPLLVPLYDVLIDASDNAETRRGLRYARRDRSRSWNYWDATIFAVFSCFKNTFHILSIFFSPVLFPTAKALEVLKICGGLTETVLSRRMLLFDGADPFQPWRTIKLREKIPSCAGITVF
ncbi:ThiF family protein [Cardiosporidium cionae]|uniref:ThiF family protein n=1 Tax=Cardiosporidium cionae TaxID=476202 RepID=A0ABQ7J878_9APIC|nr:ThiF family protein [Cardiosporidium cionae]|eukprot:KAF8820187.1 ThiF family protein [Cardiosporidium cionae]